MQSGERPVSGNFDLDDDSDESEEDDLGRKARLAIFGLRV